MNMFEMWGDNELFRVYVVEDEKDMVDWLDSVIPEEVDYEPTEAASDSRTGRPE